MIVFSSIDDQDTGTCAVQPSDSGARAQGPSYSLLATVYAGSTIAYCTYEILQHLRRAVSEEPEQEVFNRQCLDQI